jgi:hypothetical protein
VAADLLEREREFDAIGRALARAADGQGTFELIEAPAGIGKTSLLRAAGDRAAAAGFTCLRARASELERGFAYGCVRQLLEPVVSRSGDGAAPMHGTAALCRPLFDVTEKGVADAFAMLHGLYWLLNVALLRGAAHDALARGAPDAAAAWLSRALAEPPPRRPARRGAAGAGLRAAAARLGSARPRRSSTSWPPRTC